MYKRDIPMGRSHHIIARHKLLASIVTASEHWDGAFSILKSSL